jgi:hypothetical protein
MPLALESMTWSLKRGGIEAGSRRWRLAEREGDFGGRTGMM